MNCNTWLEILLRCSSWLLKRSVPFRTLSHITWCI
jgi:hypothetical protein